MALPKTDQPHVPETETSQQDDRCEPPDGLDALARWVTAQWRASGLWPSLCCVSDEAKRLGLSPNETTEVARTRSLCPRCSPSAARCPIPGVGV